MTNALQQTDAVIALLKQISDARNRGEITLQQYNEMNWEAVLLFETIKSPAPQSDDPALQSMNEISEIVKRMPRFRYEVTNEYRKVTFY